MKICTFFGHRSCPSDIEPSLRTVLVNLIEEHNISLFYVGNQGKFDYIVIETLTELSKIYSNIEFYIVLAYIPNKISEFTQIDYSKTLVPNGLENVPPKFSIYWRNKWMLKQSDYVVTYITNSFGGASQFAKMAYKQNKTVINLG